MIHRASPLRRYFDKAIERQPVPVVARGPEPPAEQVRGCRVSATIAAVGGSWIMVGFAVFMFVVPAFSYYSTHGTG